MITEKERRKTLPKYAKRQDLLKYYEEQDKIKLKNHKIFKL